MLQALLNFILGVLLKKAPSYVITILKALVAEVVRFVQDASEFKDMPGPEKRYYVLERMRALADEAFDELTFWSSMDEEARDRILAGLVEAAAQVLKAEQAGMDTKKLQKQAKKAGRRMRKLARKAG